MFIGGTLIRQFDGFRRLCRRSAEEFRLPLSLPEEDRILANRVLAALGGPPARPQVEGEFTGDGLSLLLLFLLTQEHECRISLTGRSEESMARLKSLVHLFGHAAWPMLTGEAPLQFQQVVKELGPSGAILRPQVRYDQEGEPVEILPTGAAGRLMTGPEGGPFTLAVLQGAAGPAPLEAPGGALHPAVLVLP